MNKVTITINSDNLVISEAIRTRLLELYKDGSLTCELTVPGADETVDTSETSVEFLIS